MGKIITFTCQHCGFFMQLFESKDPIVCPSCGHTEKPKEEPKPKEV